MSIEMENTTPPLAQNEPAVVKRDEPQDLIAMLEKATGPDGGLDLMIAEAVGLKPSFGSTGSVGGGWLNYTESLDAALTLVPEGYRTMHAAQDADGKWFWGLHMDAGHPNNPTTSGGVSYAAQWSSDEFWNPIGRGSPAIAVSIAALKARAAIAKATGQPVDQS